MTAIARACNVESNQVYIWIDYFGINQDEHELNIKEMGIESLPSYIESSDVLFTPLLDDGGPADQPNNSPLQNYYTIPPWWISLKCVADDPNEYFGRTWCRTEMYLGTNVNLPEPGFGYFKTLSIDRVGRPHFLSVSDNVLNILPPLSMSWFERFDPLKGAVHVEDDKYIIKRIMKKAPHRTASDLVDTVPLIHGKKCGRGQYTYKNGDRYDGDWVDDKRHGHGVYYVANGDRYDGDFVDGKYHGHGVYYFANGDRYDGDYVDGKRRGHGVFYLNGECYDGDWVDGKRHGHGVFYFANGNRYDGDWVDGKRHGHGVDYFASGDRYDGDYVDGKRHGHGVFYFANGNRYDGDWVDGKRHGHGVLYNADGSHYEGEWSEDVEVKN